MSQFFSPRVKAPVSAPKQTAGEGPGRALAWVDGLRVLAASQVFFSHYPTASLPRWLVGEWHLGVPLFFMLSGIVMAYNYPAARLRGPGATGRYLLRRIGRLVIIYWPLLALAWLGAPPSSAYEALLQVSLQQSLDPSYVFSGLPQAWSLTTELHFYLVWLAVALGCGWVNRRSRARLLWVGLGLTLLWLGLVASLLLTGILYPLIYLLPGGAAYFAAGLWVGRACRHRGEGGEDSRKGYQPSLSSTRTWAGGVIGGLILVGWIVGGPWLYAHLGPAGEWADGTYRSGIFEPAGAALHVVVMPLLALALVMIVWRVPLWCAFWSWEWLARLGRASYAFYLLHLGIGARGLHLVMGGSVAGQFLMLWAIALALHEGVERPLLKALHRRISQI